MVTRRRGGRPWLLVVAGLGLGACAPDGGLGPKGLEQPALVPIHVTSVLGVATLVVDVTAPTLSTPVVYNLAMTAETLADTLSIPSGAARTILIRRFDPSGIETHAGSVTRDLEPGENPPIVLSLTAASGEQPITVVLGSVLIEVGAPPDSIEAGSSTVLSATVRNAFGTEFAVTPLWASLDGKIAAVTSDGVVTAVAPGSTEVVASYGGVASSVPIRVFGDGPVTIGVVQRNALVAGYRHTCALTEDDRAYCWGERGSTGNSTYPRPEGCNDQACSVPVPFNYTTDRFVTLASNGGYGTCGLTEVGKPYCWNGPSLSDTLRLSAIAVSGNHVCGLDFGGRALCAGQNSYGELGDGTTSHRWEPALPVATDLRFRTIRTGSWITCAVAVEGGAYCWGRDVEGSGTASLTPRRLAGSDDFIEVTAGERVCGLRASGVVVCWQGGENVTTAAGAAVAGLPPVVQLEDSGNFRCVRSADGRVWCWGYNGQGQLGIGTRESSDVPVEVALPAPAVGLALGTSHACVLAATGSAWCWGSEEYGQLGNGSQGYFDPTPVAGSERYQSVTAGPGYACGLTSEGRVQCWGASNEYGALGVGDTEGRDVPTPVSGDRTFTGLARGRLGRHACAVDANGQAWCWGFASRGQIGDGGAVGALERVLEPQVVEAPVAFQSVTTGYYHTCALTVDGAAWCWGRNRWGEVGREPLVDTSVPAEVQTDLRFTSLTASAYHTCGLTEAGALWCWGEGFYAGTQASGATPVQVPGPGEAWSRVTATASYTCGVTQSGKGYCWGAGNSGALGTGDTQNSAAPTQVRGTLTWASIAPGSSQTCALEQDGTTWCWGSRPVGGQIFGPELLSGAPRFSTISMGSGSSGCGLDEAGIAQCWGWREYLGSGVNTWSPVVVTTPITFATSG